MNLNSFRIVAAAAVAAIGSGAAWANTGVQLPINQYQAGSEETTNSLITNPGFENLDANNIPVGWTPAVGGSASVMTGGAPDAAHLPTPASVLGTKVSRAFLSGGIDPFDNYKITQNVALTPNTDYVLSAYVWNYAFSGPAPHNDLSAGDLVVVEFESPSASGPSAGFILEPTSLDGLSGSGGFFIYKSFNSSQFAADGGMARLEVEFDPNQNLQFAINRPELSAQWDNIAVTPLTQFAAQKFTNPAGGDWDAAANWINGPANALSAIASLKANTVGAPTITINTPKKLAVINFDATGGFTLGGAGTIVLDHEESRDAVILNSLQASNTINNVIAVNGGTNIGQATLTARNLRVNVANGNGVLTVGSIVAGSVGTFGTGTFDVIKTGSGRFDPAGIRAQSLKIDAGEVRFKPGSATSRVGTFTIAGDAVPTAKLSLNNTAMVVDYPVAGPSPLSVIKSQLAAGFAGGNGIVSGFGSGYAVGYAEASQFGTVPAIFGSVDSTAVLLRGTIAGDANLDGTVSLADFTALAAGFGTAGDWINGNFNYNATVELGDFTVLAANFGRMVAGDVPRGTSIPEPTSFAIVAMAAATATRRRRA